MLTLKSSHRPDGIFTCFALVLAGRRCFYRQWHGDLLIVHRNWQHSIQCACSRSNFASPRWEIADVLALTHACTTANASVNYSRYVPQRPSKVPMAPMGFSHVLRFCLQGGGVYIGGGTVSFSLCTITGNTAGDVRAHAQKFPSPRWDFYMFCACACRAVVSLSLEAR